MTKAELVEAVAKQTKLSKKSVEAAVGAMIKSVTSSLKKGSPVTLVGFGTFKVMTRKARNGRNPQTGKPIKIAAARVPKFSPGKNLKDMVNGKGKK
jgi:DNA-binding protein HU-beta